MWKPWAPGLRPASFAMTRRLSPRASNVTFPDAWLPAVGARLARAPPAGDIMEAQPAAAMPKVTAPANAYSDRFIPASCVVVVGDSVCSGRHDTATIHALFAAVTRRQSKIVPPHRILRVRR